MRTAKGGNCGGQIQCSPSWLSNANGRIKGQESVIFKYRPMRKGVTKQMVNLQTKYRKPSIKVPPGMN